MFDSYLIEVDDIEAGILVRIAGGFEFHAVADRFRAFEGARFPDPWSAERALRRPVGQAGPGGRAERASAERPDRRRAS